MSKLIIILISIVSLTFAQNQDLLDSENTMTDSARNAQRFLNRTSFEYPYYLSLFGGITSIQTDMSLPIIPASDDCGFYSYGSGRDRYFGLEFGVNLFTDWISNDIRFWFDGRPVTLETQTTGPDVLNSDGEFEPLIRDHVYKAYLNYLAVDLGIRIRPIQLIEKFFDWKAHKYAPIYIRASYSTSEPTFDATFDNTQFVNSPGNVTFPNGRIDQLVSEGEIRGGRTTSALNFEVGASWQLSETIDIAPQFQYRYELEAPYEQYDWNSQVMRFGVAISFHQNRDYFTRKYPERQRIRIRTKPESKEEVPIAQVNQKPKPIVTENPIAENNDIVPIEVEDISTQNILEFNTKPLQITETIVTQTYPILPYIFFDKASSELRNNYSKNINNFAEENLPKETIGIYYNLLNIIGSRLQSNPTSNITLLGTGDNWKDSTASLLLAENRAKAVKNYFINNWNIEASRIEIETSIKPNLETNPIYEEGQEENRRVEILTNDAKLLKPVSHSKFLEFTTPSEALKYNVKLSENNNIVNANLSIYAGDTKIYTSYIAGNPGTDAEFIFPKSILKDISNEMSPNKKLTAELILEKENEKAEIQKKEIPYSNIKSSFEVGRLNLIVFDFDKAEITESNKQMLEEFITGSIKDNSKTTITGSTDRLGEARYNKRLSQERAEAVADFINLFKPNYEFKKVIGIGSSNLEFDNDSPEGRFYCRTVLVQVETPIED